MHLLFVTYYSTSRCSCLLECCCKVFAMLSLCEKPRIVIIARIVIAAAVETDSRTRSVHALGGLRAMAHRWMDESLPVYPGTVKEGYLVKSPPLDKRGVKHWKTRWFVLTSLGNEPACLLYFKDRQAVVIGRMPIKRVPLGSCFKVERALQHSSHPHVFAVHLPERVFYFSASTHDEMLSWVDALSSHLKLEAENPPSASPSASPSPHSRVQGWATLPRTQQARSCPVPQRERSNSLQPLTPSPVSSHRREQPLPPLPFSCPPTPSKPEEVPPLPQRPEALKHRKS